MIEIFGDIWDLIEDNDFDGLVITTNGYVKKNGKAVMGRGIALEAAKRCKSLPYRLGNNILDYGNHVFAWNAKHLFEQTLITFPVKHNWWEKADIHLIRSSISELKDEVDNRRLKKVIMPRPGCGNGKLSWDDEVKPFIEKLDDRFWVAHK